MSEDIVAIGVVYLGQTGSVPKGTKVVLDVTAKERLDRHKSEWDVIVHRQSGSSVILQVLNDLIQSEFVNYLIYLYA